MGSERLFNINRHHSIKLLGLASTIMLLTTGCSSVSDSENKKLTEQVHELQSENTSLKAQLAILKDSFAQRKIGELKTALAGTDKIAFENKSVESPDIASATSSKLAPSTPSTSLTSPTGAQEQANPVAKTFSDLGDCPNKDLIDDLARLHVFDDLGADFKPYQPITRAQYVTWLYKAYNAIQPGQRQLHLAPQAGPQFKDVSPSHPAYKYIQALAFTGYSIGYLDGTFRPDKPLTREEMIGIKVALDSGKDLPPYRSQMECVWKFSDSKQVDERFTGYVHQDFYISGPKGNNIQRAFGKIAAFHPKQAVLRSEAAATLWQEGQFGFNGPITAGSVTNI